MPFYQKDYCAIFVRKVHRPEVTLCLTLASIRNKSMPTGCKFKYIFELECNLKLKGVVWKFWAQTQNCLAIEPS